MSDFSKILSQAKELEAKMKESQEKIKNITIEGVSGTNSVKVTLNGDGEIIKIDISPETLKEEKTIIEDLIMAAHNNAKIKLKSKTSEEISKATGGLGIPFGLQNILPVLFNIKRTNYFFASFFGFIPIFFIWNTIGSGLNQYIKLSDNFSLINLLFNKEIYLPIFFFLIVTVISFVVKKRIFDKEN